MKIGLFDSGIGGLSVLDEAYHQLPGNDYIFYADTDHVPYGLKTHEQILGYAQEAVRFLVGRGADAVIIACNTATAVAVEMLRSEYDLPIIGMEPAVKPAVEETVQKRIMVIATPVTLREEKLKNLIARVDGMHRVDLLPLPKLVSFAEREEFESEEVLDYLEEELGTYNVQDYSALVLGCTHFNYFKPQYRRIFGDGIALIDGRRGTVRHLSELLHIACISDTDEKKQLSEKEIGDFGTQFFFSGIPADDAGIAHCMRLLKRLEAIRYV